MSVSIIEKDDFRVMSGKQVEAAVKIFRTELVNRKTDLMWNVIRDAFEINVDELGQHLFVAFRRFVEVYGPSKHGRIIRRGIKVNRRKTPRQLIDAMDRVQYVDQPALKAMPRGRGNVVDMYFFQIYCENDCDDCERRTLEDEYKMRGLTPDPYAQIQLNIDDPSFADDFPNAAYYLDNDKRLCHLTISLDDDRDVFIGYPSGNSWPHWWWFGGVPV